MNLVKALGSIENLNTDSYFVINFVNFLAPKLIHHAIAIDAIKVPDMHLRLAH